MGWIKILIGEWSRQKKNDYHHVSVNRVSSRERRLQKRGGMLWSLCPTWVKFYFNYVYISFWAPSHCKPVFKFKFYSKFVSYIILYPSFDTARTRHATNLIASTVRLPTEKKKENKPRVSKLMRYKTRRQPIN
jgi:hypothetical protein